MIQDTWKAVVSAGRIGGAPNRASLYPHRLSSNLPRNPRSCSPAPKRTRAATATLWRSPNSESLPLPCPRGTFGPIYVFSGDENRSTAPKRSGEDWERLLNPIVTQEEASQRLAGTIFAILPSLDPSMPKLFLTGAFLPSEGLEMAAEYSVAKRRTSPRTTALSWSKGSDRLWKGYSVR